MDETMTNIKPGWTGRADYAERREARIERLQDRADRHDEAAQAAAERARAAVDGIPLGQPNIGENQSLQPRLNIAQCIDPPHRTAFHSLGAQRTNGIR